MEDRRQGNVNLDRADISLAKAGAILVALVAFLWGGVVYIIIPLDTVQVTETQILVAQKLTNQNYAALQLTTAQLQADDAVNKSDIATLKQQVLGASTQIINNK